MTYESQSGCLRLSYPDPPRVTEHKDCLIVHYDDDDDEKSLGMKVLVVKSDTPSSHMINICT